MLPIEMKAFIIFLHLCKINFPTRLKYLYISMIIFCLIAGL
jgi:hypothetical protein